MQRSFGKHNLKLGVFLSYREPSEGGGFTITEDILNLILSKYRNKKIVFITLNDHKNILKKKIKKSGFECYSFYENEYLIKLKNLIFSIFPSLIKIYNKFNFNNFLNFEKKKQIDIVWFISK